MRIYTSYSMPNDRSGIELEYQTDMKAIFIEIENEEHKQYAQITMSAIDFWAMINDLRLKIQETCKSPSQLVRAMEFLVHALSTGPKFRSALMVGWMREDIPLESVQQAFDKLGIVETQAEYGLLTWALKGR